MPQNQEESLRLLLEAGRLLSSQLNLGELLVTVLQVADRLVDAETASLLLLDSQTQELYFHTALGLGEKAAQVRLRLGQGIAGCVAQNRRPEIINDVRKDPRWSSEMDERSGFTTRSILAAPLLLKDRLVGVVEVINKRAGDFGAQDLRALEYFASQAAVAIENASLFASLSEERRKLNTVFSEMTDGAILADAAGRVALANEAARKFFAVGTGFSTLAEAFAGLNLSPALPELLRASAAAGTAGAGFVARREQPQTLILAGRASRVALTQDGQGGMPGLLIVVRDATEEMHKQLLKRTFLSLISHKLKTPLSTITGYAELLLGGFAVHPPDPGVRKAVLAIAKQSGRLNDLVDKLLRFMTIESPETSLELASVPLDDVVSETLKSLQPWLDERKAEVRFQPGGACVPGDRKFLGEAVKNLVENAVKFADKPEKKVAVEVRLDGGRALLAVSDNGPGIPPEEQDRIFSWFHQVETFFTGQVEGWGLGLPYVSKVVRLHGGELRLASKLGEGTTVTMSLPLRGSRP